MYHKQVACFGTDLDVEEAGLNLAGRFRDADYVEVGQRAGTFQVPEWQEATAGMQDSLITVGDMHHSSDAAWLIHAKGRPFQVPAGTTLQGARRQKQRTSRLGPATKQIDLVGACN
jgi:hypothetical protein